MKNLPLDTIKLIDFHQPERWQLYARLRELDIDCYCSGYQPLQMRLIGPASAIQVWSVLRQMYCSQDCLRHWLECCWQLAETPTLNSPINGEIGEN